MKMSKKLLSLLLCAVMVLGSVAIGGGGFAEVLDAFSVKASAASYSDGTGSNDGWADSTHIRFGSYPQTDVTASMGKTLDAKAMGWKSYKYYSGTGEWYDGQMSSADYMMYCDVTVMNGPVPEKYRGVKFSTYRPYHTVYRSTTSTSCTNQYDNGYIVGNTYWFKYEPLVWRVLDSSRGLVMCESIIDSQAYNNYIWYGTGSKSTSSEYYGNEAHTNYANDYYNSSIRKWLTEDFYATAFSESQQKKLLEYNCDNSCYSSSYPEYDSQNSSDKVFLLSYDEVKGFNSSALIDDYARRAKGTDYAKCQGLCVYNDGSEYDGNSWWWLRSPGSGSDGACGVRYDGSSSYYYYVDYTYTGVRPALRLNLLEIMKDEAKAELAEAKMNAVSDEAKAAIDTAIENVDKATNPDAVASAKAEGTRNAENADTALADAKAEAIDAIEKAAGDDCSAALRSVVNNGEKAVNNATSVEGVDEALANALAAIKHQQQVDGFNCPDEYHLLKYKDTVTLLAESKTDKVIYATSDPSVATVDENGKVTAVGKGKCVITASVEGTDISKDVDIEVKYCCCDIILYYILRIFNFMKKIFNLIFAC